VASESFAQGKGDWFIRTNTSLVYDFNFETGITPGVGVHLQYNPKTKLNPRLVPSISLGIESTPSAWFSNVPNHFWYNYNIRLATGIEREFKRTSNQVLWLGVGTSLFIGEMISGRVSLLDQDGHISETSQQKGLEGAFAFQANFRYQNTKISPRMSFGHSFDWVVARGNLVQNFSLFWSLSDMKK
jgi:hypothetical protein